MLRWPLLTFCVFSDVYSYDEDDMVLDSKLPEHLSHFGIDMMTMEKVSFAFISALRCVTLPSQTNSQLELKPLLTITLFSLCLQTQI